VAPDSVWEIVFLMVILKIPIVYLCWVIWWAVRSTPRPEEGAAVTMVAQPDPPSGRSDWQARAPRRHRPGPHGGPLRKPARLGAASASARAKLDP
jgi:hypothetical protein